MGIRVLYMPSCARETIDDSRENYNHILHIPIIVVEKIKVVVFKSSVGKLRCFSNFIYFYVIKKKNMTFDNFIKLKKKNIF